MGFFNTKGEEEEIADIKSGDAVRKGREEFAATRARDAEAAKSRGDAATARQAEMAAQAQASDAKALAQFSQYPDVLAQLDAESRPSPIMAGINRMVGKAKDAMFPPPAPTPPVPTPVNPQDIARQKSPIMRLLASR